MYPIYIEQPQQQLSLNDYLQLQALLAQEQAEREHCLLQEYKKQQEQRRLQKAMYKLQVMTELYRQREQEERAIQAYYAAKKELQERRRKYLIQQQQRQKELLLQQRREQQERYFSALREQEELEEQYRRLALAHQYKQQLQQKSAAATAVAHPCQAMFAAAAAPQEEEPESESETEEGEEEARDQLTALVKLIFGTHQGQREQVQVSKAGKQQQDDVHTTEIEQPQPQQDDVHTTEIEQPQQQQQTMTLDEFVNYISKKAQSLDDSGSESEQEDEVSAAVDNDAMEEEEQETALLAIQHLDDNEEETDSESMDEDEDDFEQIEEVQVPSLIKSPNSIQDLVNDILEHEEEQEEQEFTQFPDEDPVKIAKYDALSRVEQELNDIQEQHEDHILHVTLDFSAALNGDNRAASPTPSDVITATTAENRKFLGYEDQIMKVLLKLDMIESDGDDNIRNERRALVKRAEEMLEKLDEYKQREWERVSCSSHSEDEDMYM
jgi:hypothetical protein